VSDSWASSPGVRRRMQLQRGRDTVPELALRRELHRRGRRYRVDVPIVPGTRRRVDIVFGRARVAVFVDGCFWHGCPEHGQRAHDVNGWYWPEKIAGNRRRDADTDARLRAAGWAVVRVWEHDDPEQAATLIGYQVDRRLGGYGGPGQVIDASKVPGTAISTRRRASSGGRRAVRTRTAGSSTGVHSALAETSRYQPSTASRQGAS